MLMSKLFTFWVSLLLLGVCAAHARPSSKEIKPAEATLPTRIEAENALGLSNAEPDARTGPLSPPLLLLYNPARSSELPIFTGTARRFMDSARQMRPKFDLMPSREKVQFLERYVYALCNSHLVNGMDLVFKMESGSENFCGYTPGMLSCFSAETCDEAAQENAQKYIGGSLAKFDNFLKWADRRAWQYRGDALKVAFYTRNTRTRSGFQCSTLKIINDNPEPVIIWLRAMRRNPDGRQQAVFTKPYYVGPRATLPNLSDEDLFAKDTENRMRKLMTDAMAVARRVGINDIQAYSGTHERWNCSLTDKEVLPQPVLQKIHIDFPK